jgi:hypothetical protein
MKKHIHLLVLFATTTSTNTVPGPRVDDPRAYTSPSPRWLGDHVSTAPHGTLPSCMPVGSPITQRHCVSSSRYTSLQQTWSSLTHIAPSGPAVPRTRFTNLTSTTATPVPSARYSSGSYSQHPGQPQPRHTLECMVAT